MKGFVWIEELAGRVGKKFGDGRFLKKIEIGEGHGIQDAFRNSNKCLGGEGGNHSFKHQFTKIRAELPCQNEKPCGKHSFFAEKEQRNIMIRIAHEVARLVCECAAQLIVFKAAGEVIGCRMRLDCARGQNKIAALL